MKAFVVDSLRKAIKSMTNQVAEKSDPALANSLLEYLKMYAERSKLPSVLDARRLQDRCTQLEKSMETLRGEFQRYKDNVERPTGIGRVLK